MKKGDTVICILDSNRIWTMIKTKKQNQGPKKLDKLIITRINESGFIGFDEYPNINYDPVEFIKIQESKESISIKLESKEILKKETIISN